MIVGTASARPPLGMSSFWIWHYTTPLIRLFVATPAAVPNMVGFYGLFSQKSIVS